LISSSSLSLACSSQSPLSSLGVWRFEPKSAPFSRYIGVFHVVGDILCCCSCRRYAGPETCVGEARDTGGLLVDEDMSPRPSRLVADLVCVSASGDDRRDGGVLLRVVHRWRGFRGWRREVQRRWSSGCGVTVGSQGRGEDHSSKWYGYAIALLARVGRVTRRGLFSRDKSPSKLTHRDANHPWSRLAHRTSFGRKSPDISAVSEA
jgi:hypothetical protein